MRMKADLRSIIRVHMVTPSGASVFPVKFLVRVSEGQALLAQSMKITNSGQALRSMDT